MKWFGVVALLAVAGLALMVWDRDPEPPDLDPSDLQKLEALGYVSEVPTDHAEEGVVLHDPERAFPGLHVFSSRTRKKALVMDMEGQLVHTWDVSGAAATTEHVELLEDGDILAVEGPPGGLCRYSWEGELRWCLDRNAHHDVHLDGGGDLLLLVAEPRLVAHDGAEYPILDDRVVRATLAGEVVEDVLSLYDLLGDRIGASRWSAIRRFVGQNPQHRRSVREASDTLEHDVASDSPYDIFHTNSIQVLDREIPGFCRPGDLLLSVRELDLVVVVDPVRQAVRWEFGPGTISRQHDARLLASDRLLLFDNGVSRRASRVVEVDPLTREIVWAWDGGAEGPFFSFFRGGAQRLPNGNTLVTDAGNGRVVEVAADGEIVWTYFSPLTRKGEREVVYNVSRLVGEQAARVEELMGRGPSSPRTEASRP